VTDKTANLGTKSFREVPLYQLSLEEVVMKLKDGEKKRHNETEPSQQAIDRAIRVAPLGLVTSLRSVATRLDVSRRVLTCCLAPQVVSWYGEALGLDVVSGEYGGLYEEVRQKVKLYPIKRQMESRARFFFDRPEPVNASVGVIRWAASKLASYGFCLGAAWDELLLSGLAWSVTTLEHQEWDPENIETIFLPEVRSVKLQVEDTKDDMACFACKYARWTGDIITQ
jgi:hypothetical protein